jgi:hypothetical protein
MSAGSASPTSESAYYYPAPYWLVDETDWLKTLLVFFDDIAILLPRYMRGRPEAADPVLANPLSEQGLLRVLEPETFVDQAVAEALAEAMLELITSGAFDGLPRPPYYAELSHSRMGWDADVELATMLIDELTARDLARPSEDGVSLPLHPAVRQTILVILAQLARAAGHRAGLDLQPVTSEPNAIDALRSTLELNPLPSAGNVIALDLKTVAVDLRTVPLDEILAFRDQNGAFYRAYMQRLREFVSQLAVIEEPAERARALADRQDELQDEAKRLEDASRLAFNRPTVGYGLAIAGSAWTAATQDPIGAALALAGLAIAGRPRSQPTSAYSYLFAAERQLSR